MDMLEGNLERLWDELYRIETSMEDVEGVCGDTAFIGKKEEMWPFFGQRNVLRWLFNDRVTNLEKDLSELKEVDQYAQAISLILAIMDRYMDNKLVRTIIREEVKTQLPKTLPKAVSDFATHVIERNVTKSLEAAVLTRSSSQPKSMYEAAASLSKFELTKTLQDKMEESKSHLRIDYKKKLYDTLVEAYKTNKDIFESYGEVFSLKRRQASKDKDQEPFDGSEQGTKRRKSNKEAESSKDSRLKEKKSSSTSKDITIENKEVKKTNKMSYLRFTKIIIDYFMSKDQSISRRNKMFWHTARDDTMFTSMRCISRHEDTQVYDEGNDTIPRVPDVPIYESESKKESWGDSGEEDKDDESDSVDKSDGNDDDDVRHATTVPEITSSFAATIPPTPPFFNPLPHQETPTPTPTTFEATTSFPSLLNFSSVFRFIDRVTNLENDLSELKEVDQYAQAISLILAIMDRYMDNKLVRRIIREEVKTQLPKILPKAVSDFATHVIERNVTKSLEATALTRKSNKEAESSKDSRLKEKKSSSTSKDASKSQHKSFGKFTHAEELSHTIEDSGMQQDQEFINRDNDEQPTDKEVTKANWFKKPEQPPTLDTEWNKRQQDFFINNELEYLKGGDLSRRYSTSVMKTKAATCEIKWIEDLVWNFDNEIASLLDTTVRHATTIPEITSSFTATIPPTPPFFNHLPHQETPTPTPTTSEATTLFPSLLNFSSVFRFNDRVTNLEKDLPELKEVDQEEVKTQLPKILPKAVSDFATHVIERNVTKSLEAAVLTRSSSQPKSTYEAAASLSKFELTKTLQDKMEERKSLLRIDYKKKHYDTLVESYNTNKDIFESYGEVFSLKRRQAGKDKDQEPFDGSEQGTKRRKSNKEAESSKDSRLKEKKSSSTSKDASKSQHKSSGKFTHAEELSHTIEDSGMQQDQEFITRDNDEQPTDKEVTKADWFKKPERPPTLDTE
nr:hypothetical protein [Tanacetum cinerariifolium]